MLKKNKGGAIINLSSTAGIFGFPLRSPYCASKWAVVGITKTLAMELGKFKIRVNAICPGTIKGDRMGRVIRDKSKFLNISKKLIEKEFVSMTSMNTWVYEEDIGKICSYKFFQYPLHKPRYSSKSLKQILFLLIFLKYLKTSIYPLLLYPFYLPLLFQDK